MSNNDIHVKLEQGTEKVLFQYQEPSEYPQRFKGTNYNLFSTESIIDLIKKRGSTANTLIYYDIESSSPGIQIILDDTVTDRDLDKASFGFAYSDKMKEWAALFDRGLSQKGLIKFLKQRDPEEFFEVGMLEWLMAVAQTLNASTEINFSSSYQNESNKEVVFKIKDAESSTKIPEMFQIVIPIYNESDLRVAMEVELELDKPKNEGDKAWFCFSCPKFTVYKKQAAKYEVDKVKTGLPGYSILAGRAW